MFSFFFCSVFVCLFFFFYKMKSDCSKLHLFVRVRAMVFNVCVMSYVIHIIICI